MSLLHFFNFGNSYNNMFIFSIQLKWQKIMFVIGKSKFWGALLFLQLLKLKTQKCAQNFDFLFKKWIFFALSYIFLKTFLYQKETCCAGLIINIKLILLHIYVQYMCAHYWFHCISPTPKSLKISKSSLNTLIYEVVQIYPICFRWDINCQVYCRYVEHASNII